MLRNPRSSCVQLASLIRMKKALWWTRLYGSMIGSLLYLITSKPDIMLSVCHFVRFQANTNESHFDLCAYTNLDFTGSKSYRKSTSGSCFFLGSCLLSWMSKKQSSIFLSIVKEEYISVGLGCA